MIPDFKTYINESAWGEMRHRGSGKSIRKEDDVNHLSQDDLYEYLKDHYKVRIYHIDNDHKPINKENEISVPFARPHERSYGLCVSLEFKKKEKLVTFSHSLKDDLPEIYAKVCDNYRVEPQTKYIDKVYPLDGGEITNKFYVDFIEFLIDNVEEDRRLVYRKSINESAWGDMCHRGSGKLIRKEDDVNNFDYEEFFVYLTEHYKPVSKKLYEEIGGRTSIVDTDIIEIFIPISPIDGRIKTLIVEMDKKDNSIVSMRTSATLFDKYINLERMLSKNYTLHTIKGSYGIYIISKEKPTNRTVIDLIDIFLAVVDNPVLEKIS